MRNLKKMITIVFIALFSVVFCSEIYASESIKDGLVMNLTSDKEEYKKGEVISLDFSIKNTNEYSVKLLETKNIVLQGFSVNKETPTQLETQELKIGETIHLRTSIVENEEGGIGAIENVHTGDATSIKITLIVVGISTFVIGIVLIFKYKSMRKSLLLMLGVSLSIATTICSVRAVDLSNQVTIEKNIIYDGNKVKVSSMVSYEFSYQDPKTPVEYQDGVKETMLNYTLDEENTRVIVFDAKIISNWKKGELHVLKNIGNPADDIAIMVQSIELLENGNAIIVYSTPELSKVIKFINYSGVEDQSGVLTPAAGITFSEINDKSEKGRSARKPRSKGTFELFEKKAFTYDKGGIRFGGELCIERLNYDFQASVDVFGINFKKGYVALESSVKLGLDINYKGSKKIKLASFEAPIGYGFSAVGDIYCYFTANGELELEYTIRATSGFDYEDEIFKGIWEMDNKLSKAKADVNLKIGCTLEPKVSFLKMGLIGGELDLGRNYELKLDEISFNPIMYCIDAGYFNYASVSAVVLPGSWDKKITVSLFGVNDSPIKENTHIEEGKIVNECSRKFGSLEGRVFKQTGENQEPLNLATITLEKEGVAMYSTNSQTTGKFYFEKQIEKGTYDIFVRSNDCETYKGTVIVKGNKNNIIEEPIVLHPYAESVTITGNIYNIDTNVPISNASVSVEGFVDRTTETNADGDYSISVPKGLQTIIARAKNYDSNRYTGTFENDMDNINLGLKKAYENEVFIIHAWESYQLDFNASKRIFIKAETDSEYSGYLDGDATYHCKANTGVESYKTVNKGSHWEIKVFSGSLSIFASDGGFDQGPDSNLSDYCSFVNMNGVDPFITNNISQGESKTFDNQVDQPKNKSFRIYCFSNDIVKGTEMVTDYYYNEHFGWDVSDRSYELDKIQNFWKPINNLEKINFKIIQGELIVYYYRLDNLTVY